MAQSHRSTIQFVIHSTGLVMVQKDVFRNTTRRDYLSTRGPTLAGAGHGLNWFWRGGRAGMGGRVRLVRFMKIFRE